MNATAQGISPEIVTYQRALVVAAALWVATAISVWAWRSGPRWLITTIVWMLSTLAATAAYSAWGNGSGLYAQLITGGLLVACLANQNLIKIMKRAYRAGWLPRWPKKKAS